MVKDFLSIARNFKPKSSATPPPPTEHRGSGRVESVESVERTSGAEWVEASEVNAQSLGITPDTPGDYDHKATLPGGVPPLQAAIEKAERMRSPNA